MILPEMEKRDIDFRYRQTRIENQMLTGKYLYTGV